MSDVENPPVGFRNILRSIARRLPVLGSVYNRMLETRAECNMLWRELERYRGIEASVGRPFEQITHDFGRYRWLKDNQCVIEVDYPYVAKERDWSNSRAIGLLRARIAADESTYAEVVARFPSLIRNFQAIAVAERDAIEPAAPHWLNEWFPPLDAMALYAFLVHHKPRRYVEVGSGNSTKFARQAIRDHGLATTITSIDPDPRAEVDAICDHVIRQPLEEVDSAFFADLTADDLLFVDSSHRSFPNSDVTVFFTEILPLLPPGMLYGLHDITLPYDYPQAWDWRMFNEQYMLAAYLFGGGDGDRIILPTYHVGRTPKLVDGLSPIFTAPEMTHVQNDGTSFWLRKGARD